MNYDPFSRVVEYKKPEIGIMPERMWKEERVWDLIECLARNRNNETVPQEWMLELRKLLNQLYIPTVNSF